jgi:uroporphyrinogen-III synthase
MKILLIRANRNEVDREAFEAQGIETVIDPFLQIEQVENLAGAQLMLDALKGERPKWLILTSSNALTYWQNLLPAGALQETIKNTSNIRFAAIGSQTEKQLLSLGAKTVIRAGNSDSESLGQLLAGYEVAPAIIPAGDIAMKNLENHLLANGSPIVSEVVYSTRAVISPPRSIGEISSGEITGVLFRSPSAVRSFFSFVPDPKLLLLCGGATTANAVRKMNREPDFVSVDPDPEAIAKSFAQQHLGKKEQEVQDE